MVAGSVMCRHLRLRLRLRLRLYLHGLSVCDVSACRLSRGVEYLVHEMSLSMRPAACKTVSVTWSEMWGRVLLQPRSGYIDSWSECAVAKLLVGIV